MMLAHLTAEAYLRAVRKMDQRKRPWSASDIVAALRDSMWLHERSNR